MQVPNERGTGVRRVKYSYSLNLCLNCRGQMGYGNYLRYFQLNEFSLIINKEYVSIEQDLLLQTMIKKIWKYCNMFDQFPNGEIVSIRIVLSGENHYHICYFILEE